MRPGSTVRHWRCLPGPGRGIVTSSCCPPRASRHSVRANNVLCRLRHLGHLVDIKNRLAELLGRDDLAEIHRVVVLMIVLAEAEWTPHRGEFTFFDGAQHPVSLDGLRTADGPPSCHRAVVDDDDPIRGTARAPDLVARDEP